MNDNNMMNVGLTPDNAGWLLNIMVNEVRRMGLLLEQAQAHAAKLQQELEAKKPEEKKESKKKEASNG